MEGKGGAPEGQQRCEAAGRARVGETGVAGSDLVGKAGRLGGSDPARPLWYRSEISEI